MCGILTEWINLNLTVFLFMGVLMGKMTLIIVSVLLFLLLCYSYSRRVLWLHVGQSNNDPEIIAYYYLKCVDELGGASAAHTLAV